MPTTAATAPRDRTGGPQGDSPLLEHLLGWTPVVLAMLLTQTGLV
ncbi:SCO1431 family membrane protein [Streptomyces sioyaensis]